MGLLEEFINGNPEAPTSKKELQCILRTSLELNKKMLLFLEQNTDNSYNSNTKIRPSTLVLAEIEMIVNKGHKEWQSIRKQSEPLAPF